MESISICHVEHSDESFDMRDPLDLRDPGRGAPRGRPPAPGC
jgi:hypothetical protein